MQVERTYINGRIKWDLIQKQRLDERVRIWQDKIPVEKHDIHVSYGSQDLLYA